MAAPGESSRDAHACERSADGPGPNGRAKSELPRSVAFACVAWLCDVLLDLRLRFPPLGPVPLHALRQGLSRRARHPIGPVRCLLDGPSGARPRLGRASSGNVRSIAMISARRRFKATSAPVRASSRSFSGLRLPPRLLPIRSSSRTELVGSTSGQEQRNRRWAHGRGKVRRRMR